MCVHGALTLFAASALALFQEPNLTMLSVDADQVSTDCQTLAISGTATATIENTGDAAAGAFMVLFFEDRNGNGSYDPADDQVLGQAPAGPLAAGDTAEVSAAVSGTVLFAGNLVYALADSGGDVDESDEDDNLGNSGEACQFEPPVGPFSLVEEWNWRASTTLPTHVQVMMTPVVANLTDDNGDGLIDDLDVPDVIFSTFAGGAYFRDSVVRAVNGDDGTEIFTTPLTSDLDVLGEGCIAVGDIDGDGLVEIIANEDISETHDINSFGRLIVFENDGTFKFRSDLMADGRLRWGGAALADLNADGMPEIIVGRIVLDSTGTIIAVGNSRRGSNGIGPLSTVADVDRDGIPDIVAGFTVYDVLIDGANNITGLAVKWEALDAAGDQVSGDGFPGVANFDDDDRAEVVVVSAGSIWLFDDDGSHLWGPSALPGGGAGGAPNIDDFDNDGEVEIGTAGQSRYAVFETDGSLRWSSPTFDTSSRLTASSVFDFEGDGSAEVIYKDQTFLRVYRGTDGFILAQIATGSGTTYENPVIADVDRDGNAEIVICANDYAFGVERGIQVFGDANDQWVNTRRIWNQHTYHITNVNDDGCIPVVEADNWVTFNNFRSQEEGDASTIFAAPDLTASWIRVDPDPCPDGVGITVRIGNGGSNVAAAPVDVAFFDGDPMAGGVLLGVAQTTVDLTPGTFEDVTLFLFPALEGAHTICVAADDDGFGMGSASECDEDNNGCCADISSFCCEPVAEPQVRTQGFWKRQCKGMHPSGEHERLPDYVGCVSGVATFGDVDGVDALCDRLRPSPPSDKCEQAEAQFMALLLNVCSGRVEPCNCVIDPDLGETTVGEVVELIDGLLSNPNRTFEDCVLAQALADRINNGLTLVDCP